MAYFRVLSSQLSRIQSLLDKEESWAILINADPDALASALALQRLMRSRVKRVVLARINDITRPDNLAMIRYLRIPVVRWRSAMRSKFQRFAIVDSQPHHDPAFGEVEFSIVIDHHPLPESPAQFSFQDIRPDYGSVSTMMTEYLYTAGIRPGRLLATALQYGIRTDTGTFGRNSTEVDLRAYHYLSRFGDSVLMTRILRSEYLPEWLPYFSRAFETLRSCGRGSFAWLGKIESSDILVVIADFFLKVHGLRWVAVCGVSAGRLIAVFRGGIGKMDMGAVASDIFFGLGSGGGHTHMARAEMLLADVPATVSGVEDFVFHRLYRAAEGRKPGAT
jgi:nanoRNase/pAp phosphatase (c-di-AMP/oligoRNAs hydrolase)